jgi:hypothetical protein
VSVGSENRPVTGEHDGAIDVVDGFESADECRDVVSTEAEVDEEDGSQHRPWQPHTPESDTVLCRIRYFVRSITDRQCHLKECRFSILRYAFASIQKYVNGNRRVPATLDMVASAASRLSPKAHQRTIRNAIDLIWKLNITTSYLLSRPCGQRSLTNRIPPTNKICTPSIVIIEINCTIR